MAERLAAPRVAERLNAGAAGAGGREEASVRLRLVAYLLDSVALFAFTMIFASIALLYLFLRTDLGETTSVPDGVTWACVGLLMAAIPVWYVANVYLCKRRAQTIGQYLTGLGIADESGRPPGLFTLIGYFLALHPLLFHPIIGVLWFAFAWTTISLAENSLVFVAVLSLVILCIAAPVANLVFALSDPQRRGIHDRLAGLRVVRLRQGVSR
jgi:uncharacterized RDD family membrane protein YckC